MGEQNLSNSIPRRLLQWALLPVWLILFVFIRIGDTVRFVIRTIFRALFKSYNLIKHWILETDAAIISWISEKSNGAERKKNSRQSKQKQQPVVPWYSAAQSGVRTAVLTLMHRSWNGITALFRSSHSIIRSAYRNAKEFSAQVHRKRAERQQCAQLKKARQQQLKTALHIPSFSQWAARISDALFSQNATDASETTATAQNPSSAWEKTKSFTAGVSLTILFFFVPYEMHGFLKALPNPQLLSRRDLQVTTKIFDRNDVLLYEIYTDQNRSPKKLSEIPKTLKEATIAIEDGDFYRHQGISVRGIIRALRETVLNNRLQGGSTITQQLIKSALLSPDIKITRKIKEIILAFWAERLYSKNQILEMYLNQVPYGGTAWGVEAASRTYFGKSVTDLNLAESALLAGLPAAPTEYSPFGSHPEKAFIRQKEVLRRMVQDRYITKSQADEALNYPMRFSQPETAIRAPHFVMYVKNLLEKQYGERLVEQGGLQIKTSLDIAVQEKAEQILKNQIDGLASLNVGNGAVLITNPKTGEILAMVGSKNYFDIDGDGNVNVTTSLRQPGSSIKAVNYAAALEHGFTAATLLDDSPITYQIPGSKPYSPVNYDGRFHGIVPLRYAFANSYNIPAVKVLAAIGVQTMVDTARQMGITTWGDPSRFGLSLTLGGGEVTMLDMAKAYGTLANGGVRMNLLPILEVTDYTGRVYEKHNKVTGVAALKPETAYIISDILSDNSARVQAFGPNSSLVIDGKTVSVKTGTTDDKRDNWTIGYTPSFVTVVWVGNNDNSPMNPYLTSGITGAAPIWHDVMTELLTGMPDELQKKPETIVSIPCYFGKPELFAKGTEPTGGKCAVFPTPTASVTPAQ